MSDDLIRRLTEPPFGTETSERNLMTAAAAEITRLRAQVEAANVLTEALTFYADDEDLTGYDVELRDYGLSLHVGKIITDAGEKARAALATYQQAKEGGE